MTEPTTATPTRAPAQARAGKSRFARVMRILGAVYVLGALIFFFFPNELVYLINVGPRVFRLGEALPDHCVGIGMGAGAGMGANMGSGIAMLGSVRPDAIWNLCASALAMTLAATSFFAASSFSSGYLWIHQIAKVMMIAGAAYFFLDFHHYFAYVVIGAIEAALFALVCWSWLLRPRSVTGASPRRRDAIP